MKRLILLIAAIATLSIGLIGSPADAAPTAPESVEVAEAVVGSPAEHGGPTIFAICTYVGAAYGYRSPQWYVHTADSWYVHYGGHHIVICALRVSYDFGGREHWNSLCFWHDWERGTTGGFRTAPKGTCF